MTWLYKIISSRLAIFAVLLVCIWVCILLVNQTWQQYDLKDNISQTQTKIDQEKKENLDLKNTLASFSSVSFLEKQARYRLNLKKPNEQVVFLPKSDLSPEPENSSSDSIVVELSERPNWQKWLDYFFGRD